MIQYKILCTEKQVDRALKLGAPIQDIGDGYIVPTAEEMCGWLRDKGLFIETTWHYGMYNGDSTYTTKAYYQFCGVMMNLENQRNIEVIPKSSYKESVLECIDRALDYLESFKKE